MPIYQDVVNLKQQMFTLTSSGWRLDATANNSYVSRYKDVPTSLYRKKPVDLFRFGTARTVKTYVNNDRLVDAIHANRTNRTKGMPAVSLYAYQHLSLPAAAVPSYESMYNTIRKKIRRDAVNLAMMLAEYRQTAQLFADAARFVTTRGKGLARNAANAKSRSKSYLAYQYGISPLCSDIVGAIRDLRDAAGQPLYLHGVETRKARASRSGLLPPNSGVITEPARFEMHHTQRRRTRWRAELNTDPVISTLAAHGFTNPFALAYELIPYSFVLDWWINVGDVLASLDNLVLCKGLYVIDSDRASRLYLIDATGPLVFGGYNRLEIDSIRKATTSIPVISTLSYKPSVSLTHILNGLALLHTAKRGLR